MLRGPFPSMRGPPAGGLSVLLSVLLSVALALIPTGAAAAGREPGSAAAAAAAGRISGAHLQARRGGGGRRGGLLPGFTLNVFGFGVVALPLPDIRMPTSAIEVRLVTQRVIDPIHYGNYCGPSPEITPGTGCQHPLSLAALDESDEVCKLHDHYYCKCDSLYTKRGLQPPSSVLIATRSLSSGIRKEYFSKLDKDYTLCIHEADQEMIGRFDKMAVEGRLPEAYWDPVTRWKFDSLLTMFRRNLDLDSELLAIQGQETRVESAEKWFGEPVEDHMARQKAVVAAALGAGPVAGENGGTDAVITAKK